MTQESKRKEFGLSSWSVRNRISVYVMVFIISIIGSLSYQNMPKESFPEISIPTIYINTPYPGNSPVDMENLITRPIEKELKSTKGINKLKSTSIQDFSIIIAEFSLDVDPKQALSDVKDAVDRAKSDLPQDLPTEPNVLELDFSEMPVMNVNISGDYPYAKLKEYAEWLQDRIEELPEVNEVDISGLQENEVEIAVDRLRMEALEISLVDIERAIQGENISMSGGDIKSIEGSDISRRSLRIDGEFKNFRDLEGVIVKNEFQNIVYLRDVASVHFGPKEPTSFARLDGQQVLTLDVKKKKGENLLNAADQINDIIAEARKDYFPADLKTVVTNDQSVFTRDMVANLENSIIMGVLLVILVLMFFLGLRNALFVGIAIPLSMLMGIGVLYFSGTTLNMMVLFSLILALGMLVDNGIVVVENIYRMRFEEGFNAEKSSRYGVGEVAIPIIASTATTLAAFLPLLFWKDIIGEFMKYLPITLIIVLASSLFVALVINPVLTADYMKDQKQGVSPSKTFWRRMLIMLVLALVFVFMPGTRVLGALFVVGLLFSLLYRYGLKPGGDWFMASVMPRIEEFYSRSARSALSGRRPLFYVVGTFLLLIGSIMFFGLTNPKITFFPDNEPRQVNLFIETPLGTDIEKTNEITRKLETLVEQTIAPHRKIVEAVLVQVGERTSDPNEGPQAGSSPHKARITVSFLEYAERQKVTEVRTGSIMASIKSSVEAFPEASITIAKDNMGPPVGKPINLEVRGTDYLELIAYVESIKKSMEDADIPGVDQLKTDLELGKPMLEVSIDREAARRFNLSTMQIASEIRTALQGKEISKYKEGEDDYEINLRFDEPYRYNLSNLLNAKITFRDQSNGKISQVPISAVCDINFNSTYGTVRRNNQERVITIFSEVEEGFNANEIITQYKDLMKNLPDKEGYSYAFTGEQEEQNKSLAFMSTAMLIAVFLIFLIIVTQFNSVIGPLIIMLSVLFSTIGVFLGFGITGMEFSILMCGIGIISLAGVVVNNAIVLIDYTNLLRARKREELNIQPGEYLPYHEIVNTIVDAGKTRLRPVLLTAITTVLGLIPLAIGLNIDFFGLMTSLKPDIYFGGDNAMFWGPMAWTVIFGLTFATFLTLIIVPVMYLLADKITLRVKKGFRSDNS